MLVAAVEGCSDEDGDRDLLAGVGELALEDADSAIVTRLVGVLCVLLDNGSPDELPATIDRVLANGEGGLSDLLTVLLLTSAIQLEKGDVPLFAVPAGEVAPEDREDLCELERTTTALFLALITGRCCLPLTSGMSSSIRSGGVSPVE